MLPNPPMDLDDPRSSFLHIGPRSIRDLFLVWKVQKIYLGSTSRKVTLMDPPKKGQQKNNIEGRVWRSKALVFAYRINHVPILKHTLLSVV